MQYAKLDKNGGIIEVLLEEFLYTYIPAVVDGDGNILEEAQVLPKELPEGFVELPDEEFIKIKQNEKRIIDIKEKAEQLINLKYPNYKQLNITRLGGTELELMGNYIDSIRNISNEAERNGIFLSDIVWGV